MTASTLADYSTRVTPQGRAADPRQRPNNAGGYTFVASDDARLRRFLVLGLTAAPTTSLPTTSSSTTATSSSRWRAKTTPSFSRPSWTSR
jgi:hypothetical protein